MKRLKIGKQPSRTLKVIAIREVSTPLHSTYRAGFLSHSAKAT